MPTRRKRLSCASCIKQRRFVVARHAPRRPDIHDRDRALEARRIEAGNRRAVALQAGDRRQRRFAAPDGRSAPRGSATDRRRRGGTETARTRPRKTRERQRARAAGAGAGGSSFADVAHAASLMSALPPVPSRGRSGRRRAAREAAAFQVRQACAAARGNRASPRRSARRRR